MVHTRADEKQIKATRLLEIQFDRADVRWLTIAN